MLLYDNSVSTNALKVRFLLAELGLAYDRREVPLSQPRPDWYLAQNPLGGVPTLEDDGLVTAESNAVLRYLAQRDGREDLYPSAPTERVLVDQLLDRFATALRPPFFQVSGSRSASFKASASTPVHAMRPEPRPRRRRSHRTRSCSSGCGRQRHGARHVHDRRLLRRARALPYPQHGDGPHGLPRLLRLRETVTARDGLAAADPML